MFVRWRPGPSLQVNLLAANWLPLPLQRLTERVDGTRQEKPKGKRCQGLERFEALSIFVDLKNF